MLNLDRGRSEAMNLSILKKFNKDYLFVFFTLWLVTGLTINTNDQRAFNLQQMGVDAIVSYGTLTLGHSKLPILKPIGDTFYVKKGIVPAKQPGQFATGAVAYFVISNLGMTYEKNYVMTASLVTWFSASLVSAIALTLLFCMLKGWGYRRDQAMWATFAAGVFSHWLVFAGIAHHDILATSYLLIALYFSEKSLQFTSGKYISFSILGGLFAGLTIFTSMLPALIVVAFGLYIFTSLRIGHILWTGLGFFLGLLPLALYNNYYFDSPFTQANVAGNYADTFFNFNYEQFKHHLNAYVGWGGLSILKYSPIVAIGFIGIFCLPRSLGRLKFFVLAASFVHLMYLVNIETLGTCQYGPRYLIPLLPFWAIGVAVLLNRFGQSTPFSQGLVLGVLAVFSLVVSLAGAFGGAMQCDLNSFVFIKYIAAHNKYRMENLPLFWELVWLLVAVLMLGVFARWQALKQFFKAEPQVYDTAYTEVLLPKAVASTRNMRGYRLGTARPRLGVKRR